MPHLTDVEFHELRRDVEIMRRMTSVKHSSFCQLLFDLVDALEARAAIPYDHEWLHTIDDLGEALGLEASNHPANTLSMATELIRSLPEQDKGKS